MFAYLLDLFTWVYTALGLWGFLLIVILENFIFPIPSELVLPFAGFLAYSGYFSITSFIIVSVIGSVIGSTMSYALGRYGGLPFIKRYGHWFLLHPKDLDKAHAWFERNGSVAVFICRFLPGVRQISSIPAGAARMPLGSFIFWTALGSLIWNAALIWVGYKLGPAWTRVTEYTKYLDIIVVIAILACAAYWWHRHGRELIAEWRSSSTKAGAQKRALKKSRKAHSSRAKKRRT